MKVRTRLYLSSVISIGMVAMLVLAVVLISNKITKAIEKYSLANDLYSTTAELNILSNQYLLHHENRLKEQWEPKYNFMALVLAAEAEMASAEKEIIGSVQTNYVALGDLFSQVIANYEKKQKLIQEGAPREEIENAVMLEEKLASRLLTTSQSMLIGTFQLAEGALFETMKAQALAQDLFLFSMLILLMTSVITTFIVARVISKSLGKLTEGVEIIRQGDLAHRIDIKSNDEIGQLAEEFNKMAAELKGFYTGLEGKVQERNRELTEAKVKNEAILSSIGDGVAACDKNGRIILFNSVAEALSGFSAKEAVGSHYRHCLKFVFEDSNKPRKDFIGEAIQTGEKVKMAESVSIVRKDGKKIPVDEIVAPIKNAKGRLIGCVVILRDIARERDIDRMKTEFFLFASHQIKAPLTAISWLVEMLSKEEVGKLSDKQKEYLVDVYDSAQWMVELINDLSNVSRIETGRLKIVPKPKQFEEIIQNVIDDIDVLIKKRKCRIVFNKLEKNLPPVSLDEFLIRQVVHNLLTNAVRYSKADKGQVRIKLEKRAQENDYFLSVSDNGIGIPEDKQPRIFEKFFRADNARKAESEGTGLGLYISKMIIETSGGKIWFESEENKGTTFYVSLPPEGMKEKKGEKELMDKKMS